MTESQLKQRVDDLWSKLREAEWRAEAVEESEVELKAA